MIRRALRAVAAARRAYRTEGEQLALYINQRIAEADAARSIRGDHGL